MPSRTRSAGKVGISVFALAAAFLLNFLVHSKAQTAEEEQQSSVPALDPNCPFFGPKRDEFARQQLSVARAASGDYSLSRLTEEVARHLPDLPGAYVTQSDATQAAAVPLPPPGSRTSSYASLDALPTIDRYIFTALQQAGVTPAQKTNDFEFIRRVTLDLTGHIPTPERVLTFVADTTPDKRARLIEELVNSPAWVDKWTTYYGDLFQNSSRTTQINRYQEGTYAFYNWIRESLAAGKPYDQMAREVIAGQSADASIEESSFTKGPLNFIAGGVVTGGPTQDIWDQQTVDISQTFLGISHMNCLLCHNGRGHLDSLSLWGKNGTRMQAWQMASFLSRTATTQSAQLPPNNHRYWSVQDNTRFTTDYALNTTTGNRPARQPTGGVNRVAPQYWFNSHRPAPGENYRVALAREITSDTQFARAAVNYLWREFFGTGLVDPADQFDPARLDPDNPPPAPWTLQPSNPRLLNALAQDFINSGYDLKSTMRAITNSTAYQLSARYDGTWDSSWQNLYARKLVRRLWAEEIHDAIVQASGIVPRYTVTTGSVTFGPVNSALQLPETDRTPDNGGAVSRFLDSFLRGNRVDQDRRQEGSPSQALSLMNDTFVMSRIRATGSGAAASLLARNLPLPDDQLVTNLFLTVLSRLPSDSEKTLALANLKSGTRAQQAENLLWTLYNKIDFIYNY